MKIIPLLDRILVEPIDENSKSIVLRPETEERKRPERGRVVAVGKEYKGELKKGDEIMYQKFGPEMFEVEGKKFYCGAPEDFYLKLEK